MIQIYHNPRCRKSREGLALLEASEKPYEVIPYLDKVPTKKALKTVLKYLGMKPEELVRTNESIWKENYKGKEFTDDAIIEAMLTHPKLIERPIVINGTKAVIGRPTEKIKTII